MGRWITTKDGRKVFIQDKDLSKKTLIPKKEEIEKETIEKEEESKWTAGFERGLPTLKYELIKKKKVKPDKPDRSSEFV